MHDHDFAEPTSVEVDEVVVVYQRCHHRPIFGSQYSERHDEVFYDEGPRCDARRTTYYRLEEVHYNGPHGSKEVDIDEWFDSDQRQAEDAMIEAEGELETRPLFEFDPDFDEEISVTVEAESNVEDTTDSFTFVYRVYDQEVIR